MQQSRAIINPPCEWGALKCRKSSTLFKQEQEKHLMAGGRVTEGVIFSLPILNNLNFC
jgi:hypothetical protein